MNFLFSVVLQGMAPVYKIVPEKPAWERIRDKIVLIVRSYSLLENYDDICDCAKCNELIYLLG